MADLTQRQIKILKCITEEFIETASPVGSETLEKKYSLGISSATIRNEMATLTQMGFLKKGHLSAGRLLRVAASFSDAIHLTGNSRQLIGRVSVRSFVV